MVFGSGGLCPYHAAPCGREKQWQQWMSPSAGPPWTQAGSFWFTAGKALLTPVISE